MIKLSNEKLEAIVEQSGDDGNFYSLTDSKEIADIYGSDTSTMSADALVSVTWGILEEIIECQDNDRDLRLKLARIFFTNATLSASVELESCNHVYVDERIPEDDENAKESWAGLDDLGLQLYQLDRAYEKIKDYLSIEIVLVQSKVEF